MNAAGPVLALPEVTLCAVTGRLIPLTLDAMDKARACATFGDVLFVTDRPDQVPASADMRVVAVPDLQSRERYSLVVQQELARHVRTAFVMIVQWDGYPVRPANWTGAFLDHDYIGAPWPQFAPPHAVGNGGFSLRSRRLLEACLDPRFVPGHPEDLGICHRNRDLLEGALGLRFAPAELAARFSYERSGVAGDAFGFHSLFNMPSEMGMAAFLDLFRALDLADIGSRELCDLRDVLMAADTRESRAAAGDILRFLLRFRWKETLVLRALGRDLLRPFHGHAGAGR